MERRTFLTVLTGAPVVMLFAACGSDDVAAPGAPLPDASPRDGGDGGDVRLEFGYYGGFTTREISFQMQPRVLVADGRIFTPGAVPAVYPGPLLPVDVVRSVTPEGIQALVDAARTAGMLTDVSYEADSAIADASTATLLIELGDQSYRHEAYALGAGGLPNAGSEQGAARQAFAAFAERLVDVENLVGAANLGPEQVFTPESYQLIAFPAEDLSGYDIEPTVLDWPSSTGIVLADLTGCVEVRRQDVGDLFDSATQLTFFVEDGVTYSVVPRPAYPGRACA